MNESPESRVGFDGESCDVLGPEAQGRSEFSQGLLQLASGLSGKV